MQRIGQLIFELMNMKAELISQLFHLQKTLKLNLIRINEMNTQMSLVYMKREWRTEATALCFIT